jgi:hypothetical protein
MEANMPALDMIPSQEIWRKIADPHSQEAKYGAIFRETDRNMEKNMEANMERVFLESKGLKYKHIISARN